MDDEEIVKNPRQARQGETSGHMRWVLGLSVSLAIIVLGAVFLSSIYSR